MPAPQGRAAAVVDHSVKTNIAPGSPSLSIIIPVLNEAQMIIPTLQALQYLRQQGAEVIVVDGGSQDESRSLAIPLADRVLRSPPGRARQMNAGAAVGRGDILLFLHADTLLPANARELIMTGIKTTGRQWGRFDVSLSGDHFLLPVIGYLMNLRSRFTGIATGDQAMFIERETFAAIGGYANIPLMEDICISKQLKRISRPLCLRQRAVTSSRRWNKNGVIRTVLLMWRLRFAYMLGMNPSRLADLYRRTD